MYNINVMKGSKERCLLYGSLDLCLRTLAVILVSDNVRTSVVKLFYLFVSTLVEPLISRCALTALQWQL